MAPLMPGRPWSKPWRQRLAGRRALPVAGSAHRAAAVHVAACRYLSQARVLLPLLLGLGHHRLGGSHRPSLTHESWGCCPSLPPCTWERWALPMWTTGSERRAPHPDSQVLAAKGTSMHLRGAAVSATYPSGVTVTPHKTPPHRACLGCGVSAASHCRPPCVGSRAAVAATCALLPWACTGSMAAPGTHTHTHLCPHGHTLTASPPTHAHPPKCLYAQTHMHPRAHKHVHVHLTHAPPCACTPHVCAPPHLNLHTPCTPCHIHSCRHAHTHRCMHIHVYVHLHVCTSTHVQPPCHMCNPTCTMCASSLWGLKQGTAKPALVKAGCNPLNQVSPCHRHMGLSLPIPDPAVCPSLCGPVCSCHGVDLASPVLLLLGYPHSWCVAPGVATTAGHPCCLLLQHFLAPATP